MNKLLILPLALSLSTGCLYPQCYEILGADVASSETMAVQFMEYDTVGVAPGEESHLGMLDSTCGFDADGFSTYDDDVAANQVEIVADSKDGNVLVIVGGSLLEHTPSGPTVEIGGSGIITAAYVDGGAVALSDTGTGCTVQWTMGLFGSAEVPSCDPTDLSVDRAKDKQGPFLQFRQVQRRPAVG